MVYVWMGLWLVADAPSPNDQSHVVGELVDESINWTEKGSVPEVWLATNAATGVVPIFVTEIYPDFVTVALPAALDAVSVTE